MDLQVRVTAVLEEQRFTSQKNGNEYVKNVFVGETQGQYPRRVAFSVMGRERFVSMSVAVGGVYIVSFDVESREWQGRWFTDCLAWKAVRIDGQQQPAVNQQTASESAASASTPASSSDKGESKDDLPF